MLWRTPSPTRHPPGFIEPALPTLGRALPAGPQWVHEIKHDGYRFICRVEGNRIRVFSRRGNEYTERVSGIVDSLARLPGIQGRASRGGISRWDLAKPRWRRAHA